MGVQLNLQHNTMLQKDILQSISFKEKQSLWNLKDDKEGQCTMCWGHKEVKAIHSGTSPKSHLWLHTLEAINIFQEWIECMLFTGILTLN